jgi:hypothetical protein
MSDDEYQKNLISLKKVLENFENINPMALMIKKDQLLKKVNLVVNESLNRLEGI